MLLYRTQDLKHSIGIILINITAFQNFHCYNFNYNDENETQGNHETLNG